MGEIKLFRRTNGSVAPLESKPVALEKHLQDLIERDMDTLLGVRFLASEYSTGLVHKGRIDTLGLDEDYSPVIVEYKRGQHENVINQGLFYLDWLLDHRADFEMLVLKKFGAAMAERVDWSAPRLLCVARDFTRYDGHAVQQIDRNIELIRYQLFGEDLLLLELMNATTATGSAAAAPTSIHGAKTKSKDPTHEERLQAASPELRALYDELREHMLALGDDVQERTLKLYASFKRIRNFASVVVQPYQAHQLTLYLKVDPSTVEIEEGFTRDVTHIGHWGTGNLEVTIRTPEDLQRALPLVARSFESN